MSGGWAGERERGRGRKINIKSAYGQDPTSHIFLGWKEKGNLLNRGEITDRLTILWGLF